MVPVKCHHIGFYMVMNRCHTGIVGLNQIMIMILETYSLMLIELLSILPLPNPLLFEQQKLNNYNIDKNNIGDRLPVQSRARYDGFNLILMIQLECSCVTVLHYLPKTNSTNYY